MAQILAGDLQYEQRLDDELLMHPGGEMLKSGVTHIYVLPCVPVNRTQMRPFLRSVR